MLYFALVHVVLFNISYTCGSKIKERKGLLQILPVKSTIFFAYSSNIGKTKMSMKSSFFIKSHGIQESRA